MGEKKTSVVEKPNQVEENLSDQKPKKLDSIDKKPNPVSNFRDEYFKFLQKNKGIFIFFNTLLFIRN